MRQAIIFGTLYTLFLLWQNRRFSKPLTSASDCDCACRTIACRNRWQALQ